MEPLASTADPIDLDRVFRRHASYVAAIARRLLGRDDEVDDVVQDVFVAATRRLTLRDPEALHGWLATVTVRVVQRRRRLRRLRGFVGLDEQVDAERVASAETSPEERALLARTCALLEALPADEQLAWTLRHVEGERLEAVAERCGCSLATAKRRIAAAQASLDAAIEGRRRSRRWIGRAAAVAVLLLGAAATAAVIRHVIRQHAIERPAPGAPRGESGIGVPGGCRLPASLPCGIAPVPSPASLPPPPSSRGTPQQTAASRRRREERDMKTFQRILSGAVLAPLLATSAAAGTPPESPPPRAARAPVEIPAIPATRTAPRPSPAKPAAEAPALHADDLRRGDAKIQEVTQTQIQVMQRLLDNTSPADPERADLLFRLGGLYEEQRRYFTMRAGELDQPIWEAKQRNDAASSDRLATKKRDFELRAEKSLLEAVKRYLEVADRFADYARMDEVLFDLAYLLGEAGREEAARTYFKRLIKDHPGSRYIPDAYLAFGDYYFEKRDVENALRLYEKVAQFPDSRVFAYAKYKVGWCHLNLQDWKRALQTFVEVTELARRGQGAGTKSNRIALEREAKKDAVRAYAHVGEPGKAWAFFQKIGGDYAPTMLEQLAELYNAQGQFVPAVEALHQLMAAFPSSPKLCAWQADVVRNTLSRTGAKADPASATEAARLAAVEDKLKSLGTAKPEALAECHENAAGTLRELATTWHREGQKTHDRPTWELARRAYDEYLARYPNEKGADDLAYYRAELIYGLAELPGADKAIYCDAAEAYSGVVRRDPSGRGKWLRDAAFAAVLAWKGCLDLDDRKIPVESASAQDAHRKGSLAPLPIPEKWQKMIDAFHEYLNHVPNAPERPIIAYRLGLAEYDFNRFGEAGKWFQDVARRYPDSEVGVYAAELYFDCLAAEKRTKELAAAVAEHCENPVLAKNEAFGKHCRVIEVALGREQAEHLEQAGRLREAGEAYLKLAEKFPEYAQLDELYYNGHINLEKAHRLGMSIRALQTLIEKRPDSPLAKKGLFLLGRTYQQLAAYEAAAEHYERFAERFPGEKDAPSALLTAAFFRRGLGQHDKSIEDTESFIKRWGPRAGFADRAAGAVFVEAQVFEQREDWARLEKHLGAYLKDWNARGGVDRQILAHVRLGEIGWRASCPVTPVNGACIEIHRPRPGERGRLRNGVSTTCGKGIAITVHERNPARAKEAQAHFAEALRLWKNGVALQSLPDGDDRAQRAAEMTWFAAEARMALADAEYESFLQMKIPLGLDFARSGKKAGARFLAWFEGKTRQMDRAKRSYEEVIGFKQAHFAIAAAARVGQLYQDFASQLTTAEVPRLPAPAGVDPREWAQLVYDRYCDGVMEKVDVLEAKAIDALGRCLDKSTELSWYNEWSSLCETELNQLQPHVYPLATEIRAQPGYVALSPGNMNLDPPLARTVQ